ncbi:hypothetical protein A6770_35325 [Nostoc minutum NIES-26]|uniref:Uncharacterized protein n=1 Tax=Nostoc minutum NIES-26 TaxID=1844469 RepID=A0A367RZL9_9NOSO|nr:hypothetical protein A6770_35325 [Nostoc minutum NIES-26]
MQNPSNDLDASEQKFREALEQVEVSDAYGGLRLRILPQPESIGTHSVNPPSVRSSQIAINTNINAESLSAQISENITIMQVASPLSKAEAGNDKTILQILPNPKPQNSPSVVLANHVSLSLQEPGVIERIDSSSQPTQTVETVSLTSNPIAQFSLEDDSKNLHTAGVTVVQKQNNCIIQHSDPVIQNLIDRTVIQYSDSAIHNPAERTILQAMPPLSTNLDRTFLQLGMPKSPQSSTQTTVPKNQADVQLFHPSIFREMFRTSGSFTSRFITITEQFFDSIWKKIDLKQLQSRFHLGRQLAVGKTLEQPSSGSVNRSTHNVMVSEEQPSSEQYQKKLRELDHCRLSFAKELARNGKYRNAIAMAEQISETSHFFKDAQMLIQSWK